MVMKNNLPSEPALQICLKKRCCEQSCSFQLDMYLSMYDHLVNTRSCRVEIALNSQSVFAFNHKTFQLSTIFPILWHFYALLFFQKILVEKNNNNKKKIKKEKQSTYLQGFKKTFLGKLKGGQGQFKKYVPDRVGREGSQTKIQTKTNRRKLGVKPIYVFALRKKTV